MKIVTSMTIFSDSIGVRMSITYSEVDDQTGKIVVDNTRIDRVITDADAKAHANALEEYAQTFVEGE